MKNSIKIALLALMAIGLAVPASAQRQGGPEELVLLGEQQVGFRTDRDTITVTREGDWFSGLRIQALENDVYMSGIRLVYQNGYAEDFSVERELRAGAEAMTINLDRARSYLKQIELTYRARPDARGRATVRVFGEIRREPQREEQSNRGDGEFEVIETKEIHRRSSEPVVMTIGGRKGRFLSLRLQAKGGDVRIEDVRITFGNGDVQRVEVDDRLREGEASRVIDLAGESRAISTVRIKARPSWQNRTATLVLLGKLDPRRPPPDLGRFTKVETKQISFRDDDGVVEFDVGRDEGRLAELRFLAEGGDIRIREATILFGNGETQQATIRDRLSEDELSDIINLAGEQRFVRKVRVRARLARGERAANLVLLAREDAGHRGYRSGRDEQRGREEWVTLGSQRAALFQIDTDTFSVGADKGKFRAIRASVSRQEVHFYGMSIRYGNGEVEEVPLVGRIGPGEVSQPYDLRGRDRFIESITFKYRSRISLRGAGRIEIQGLKHEGGRDRDGSRDRDRDGDRRRR